LVIQVRTRSRVADKSVGSLTSYSNGAVLSTTPSSFSRLEETCQDVTGNYGNVNPFILDRFTNDITPINGSNVSNGNGQIANNFGDTASANSRPFHLIVPKSNPTSNQLAARMSPNKPLVDLPVFLFELKDLPKMKEHVIGFAKAMQSLVHLVFHAGYDMLFTALKLQSQMMRVKDIRPHHIATANLEYQYGWAPLIGDLMKMTQFGEAFERRKAQLEHANTKSGLRRRITLESTSTSVVNNNKDWQSLGISCSGSEVITTHVERWATSRWKGAGWPDTSDAGKNWQVTRSLLGLGLSPATIWSAMPWSWMVDWFTDVGDFLETNRNTFPVYLESMAVMQSTTTTLVRNQRFITKGFTGGTGKMKLVSKVRLPQTLLNAPTGFVPALGDQQVGILASLTVASAKAWTR